ncbi:aldo/keto reductase [Spirochaeta dissipatitropha]
MKNGKLIYGCMEIGGDWSSDQVSPGTVDAAEELIIPLIEDGITDFDHADIYCRGKSELVFSQVLRRHPSIKRESLYIQSKCGIRFPDDDYPGAPGRYDFSYDHIVRSVHEILERLDTSYLDMLLLHRPDPLVEVEEISRAMEDLENEGLVRSFGVSNHSASQIALLQSATGDRIEVNQMQFSLGHPDLLEAGISINQREPGYRLFSMDTLEYCRLNKITLQAWSPLHRGRFTRQDINDRTAAEAAAGEYIQYLAREKECSPEAILIAWICRHPAGIVPVVGSTDLIRVRSAAMGCTLDLSREEWYQLFILARGAVLP